LRRKVRALAGDKFPPIGPFHPDIEIAQMKGFGFAFAGQIDMDYSGDQRRILVDANVLASLSAELILSSPDAYRGRYSDLVKEGPDEAL